MNLVKFQDAKLIHRNLLHSDTLTMKDQKEKVRKELQLPYMKKNKILRNKPTLGDKDLYSENYRKLMKEINDTNGKTDHVLGLEGSILSK